MLSWFLCNSGVDTKIHLQDQNQWAKKVWNGLRRQFSGLLTQYKIKGVDLQEWIQTYGIQGLFAAQEKDPAIRKALNDIRKTLKETVTSVDDGGQFRNNEIDAFRQEYGSNVADWLYQLTGAKRAKKAMIAPRNQMENYYGAEPDESPWDDAEVEPVEFEDLQIDIYDDAGNVLRTHRIGGSAWRDQDDDIQVKLDPESAEALKGEDWKGQEILFQISEALDIPTWDQFIEQKEQDAHDAEDDARYDRDMDD